MKKIIYSIMAFVTLLSFNACEEEDYLTFTAQPDPEGFDFTTSTSAQYLISEETESNIAERFIWTPITFGEQININYELQASITDTFDSFTSFGTTNGTDISINVEQLLQIAVNELGLDDDPLTPEDDPSTPENETELFPNNSGEIFVRLRAYPGAGTGNAVNEYSSVQSMPIIIVEKIVEVGGECDPLFILGDGVPDIAWNFTATSEIACDNNVLEAKLNFANENFRFFETFGDWNSGLGYTYFTDEGYTIDANFENAGDGDSNFRFIGTPGTYILRIDHTELTITLTPSELSGPLFAVGDAVPGGWSFSAGTTPEIPEIIPNVWEGSIALTNNIFRFFQVFEQWDTNNSYDAYEDLGYTIDENFESDGGNDGNFNFIGTPGTYTITINANSKTITLD